MGSLEVRTKETPTTQCDPSPPPPTTTTKRNEPSLTYVSDIYVYNSRDIHKPHNQGGSSSYFIIIIII